MENKVIYVDKTTNFVKRHPGIKMQRFRNYKEMERCMEAWKKQEQEKKQENFIFINTGDECDCLS